MANNKNNESIDEKAYEALENALQINFRDDKAPPRQKAQPDKAAVNKPRPRAPEQPRQRAPEAAQGQRAPSSAANDASRRTSASIMKSLDGGSLKPALRMATVISALWVLGGFALAQLLYSPQLWQIGSLSDFLALPGAGALMAGTLLPLLLFYAFAIMIARAQDLCQRRPHHGGTDRAAALVGPFIGPLVGPFIGPLVGPFTGPLLGPLAGLRGNHAPTIEVRRRTPTTCADPPRAAAILCYKTGWCHDHT